MEYHGAKKLIQGKSGMSRMQEELKKPELLLREKVRLREKIVRVSKEVEERMARMKLVGVVTVKDEKEEREVSGFLKKEGLMRKVKVKQIYSEKVTKEFEEEEEKKKKKDEGRFNFEMGNKRKNLRNKAIFGDKIQRKTT